MTSQSRLSILDEQIATAGPADRVRRRRRPNYRRVKIHRSYAVDEAARLLDIHKNTVRHWVKSGLPIVEGRPILILGQDLVAFLKRRRVSNKRPCLPGQMYCIRCRAPKFPAARMADCLPRSEKTGNLSGICPDCNCMMYRCISLSRIEEIRAELEITFPQALRQLRDISQPTVNSDLRGDN